MNDVIDYGFAIATSRVNKRLGQSKAVRHNFSMPKAVFKYLCAFAIFEAWKRSKGPFFSRMEMQDSFLDPYGASIKSPSWCVYVKAKEYLKGSIIWNFKV